MAWDDFIITPSKLFSVEKTTFYSCVGAYARNEKIIYAIRIFLRFVRMMRIYALMHVRFESVLTLCL